MIDGSRPTSPTGDDWTPNPIRGQCVVQVSPSRPGDSQFSISNWQFAILIPLIALLASLPACSRSPTAAPATDSAAAQPGDLSPVALAVSPDGQNLYVACATAKQVLVFSTGQRRITRQLTLPGEPSGLALSADGTQLFVTCAGPASRVCVMDIASGKVRKTLAAGHTALSPVLSADAKTLFVCNRFNDAVSLFDLQRGQEESRVQVAREPVSAALTRDGRFLPVANHLPRGRSDVPHVATKKGACAGPATLMRGETGGDSSSLGRKDAGGDKLQNPRFARHSNTAPTAWKMKFGSQTIKCGAHSGRVSSDWPSKMKL